MSNKENFITILTQELKKRNNPDDSKCSIIGKVVNLEPITISISDGLVLLKENNELEISEWFKFRSNIDSDTKVSQSKEITEIHSYTGSNCLLPNAIKYLADAILALKCNLAIGDYVTVSSLEETGKYVLLDKVL